MLRLTTSSTSFGAAHRRTSQYCTKDSAQVNTECFVVTGSSNDRRCWATMYTILAVCFFFDWVSFDRSECQLYHTSVILARLFPTCSSKAGCFNTSCVAHVTFQVSYIARSSLPWTRMSVQGMRYKFCGFSRCEYFSYLGNYHDNRAMTWGRNDSDLYFALGSPCNTCYPEGTLLTVPNIGVSVQPVRVVTVADIDTPPR